MTQMNGIVLEAPVCLVLYDHLLGYLQAAAARALPSQRRRSAPTAGASGLKARVLAAAGRLLQLQVFLPTTPVLSTVSLPPTSFFLYPHLGGYQEISIRPSPPPPS